MHKQLLRVKKKILKNSLAFDQQLDNNNSKINLTSIQTESEKATKQAKTLGEWRRKIYKFLEINKKKVKSTTTTTTTTEEPSPHLKQNNDDNFIQVITAEKGEEINNNICNNYKRKVDQQNEQVQNKIIRLAPIQPIFTSVKENPLKWHFGNYKIKENIGGSGCGGEEQQQLTLFPLEKENSRLKANSDKTKNLAIPLPPIQQLPPPLPPTPQQPSTFPQLPFLPLQFPNNLFPTLPPLINLFQSSTNQPEHQNPEKEYLKELENVSEDYLDEQENRLPCPERSFGCKKQHRDQQVKQKLTQTFIENNKEKQKNNKIEDYEVEEEEEEKNINQKIYSPQNLQQQQFPQWNENRQMCNSNRLKSLILQLLLNNKINNNPTTNIERSKRFLQQKAETLFGNFFNVICGTGFFSYIAHTDEFCLVAVKNVHCYVFSPVCSSQSLTSSTGGIVARQQRLADQSLLNANSRNIKNKN